MGRGRGRMRRQTKARSGTFADSFRGFLEGVKVKGSCGGNGETEARRRPLALASGTGENVGSGVGRPWFKPQLRLCDKTILVCPRALSILLQVPDPLPLLPLGFGQWS